MLSDTAWDRIAHILSESDFYRESHRVMSAQFRENLITHTLCWRSNRQRDSLVGQVFVAALILPRISFRIEAHQPMSAAHQAQRHVGAHASQTDHAEFHGDPSPERENYAGQCGLREWRTPARRRGKDHL